MNGGGRPEPPSSLILQKCVTENVVLMPSLITRTVLVYVAGDQMMSRDKLKHQVNQQFLSRDKFFLSFNKTFMSREGYIIPMTVKHVNVALTTCEVLKFLFDSRKTQKILFEKQNLKEYFSGTVSMIW